MNKEKALVVDNIQSLEALISSVKEAQRIFSTYSQEQVDKIFTAAALAANKARIPLAKMAVKETGMGIVEDKVIKNHYAAEYIYNAYKDTKTVGVIEEDKEYGIKKIAEPIGLIAAVIPTTNPTSTAIFKTLIALKTRNAIIISPHPRAKNCTIAAAKVVLDAAVKAGAPEGIIGWIDAEILVLNRKIQHLMQHCMDVLHRCHFQTLRIHKAIVKPPHIRLFQASDLPLSKLREYVHLVHILVIDQCVGFQPLFQLQPLLVNVIDGRVPRFRTNAITAVTLNLCFFLTKFFQTFGGHIVALAVFTAPAVLIRSVTALIFTFL